MMTSDNSEFQENSDNSESFSSETNDALSAAEERLDDLSDSLSTEENDSINADDPDSYTDSDTNDSNADDSSQSTTTKVKKLKANKKVKTPRKGGGAVSWLALLLALGALAGSGYTYWQQLQLTQSAQDNMQVVEDTAQNLKRDLKTDVQSQLNSFNAQSDELMNEMSSSNSKLQRSLNLDINELSARLSDAEQQVVNLKGFSDAAKHAYVKAEIEYFLQTANNRMQLAKDGPTALAALEAADERLNILRDPSLVRVRAQVRDEIQALKAVNYPDIEGLALTLASLSKQVPSLPMRMDDEAEYFTEEIPMKEGTGFRVGMSNIWRSMKGTLDKLVEVRDATPSDMPLLSEEDVRLVYTNLEIQLQSARLASLKGDSKNYQVSLDSAKRLLDVYFDTERTEVTAVTQTLDEIRNVELAPALPEISGSLKMLRQLISADKAGSQSTVINTQDSADDEQ